MPTPDQAQPPYHDVQVNMRPGQSDGGPTELKIGAVSTLLQQAGSRAGQPRGRVTYGTRFATRMPLIEAN